MDTTTALLEQATALLEHAVTEAPLRGSDAAVLAHLAAAEQIGRYADALRVQAAAEVAVRSRPEFGTESLAVRYGQRSGAALVSVVTRVSEREASRRIKLGDAIAVRASLTGETLPAEFPAVADALRSGTVGWMQRRQSSAAYGKPNVPRRWKTGRQPKSAW